MPTRRRLICLHLHQGAKAKRRYLEAARALEDDDEEDGFAIGGFEIPTLRKKQDGSFSMANPLRNGGKNGADRKKKKKKKKKKFWDRKGDDSSDGDDDSAVAFGADELALTTFLPDAAFNINAEAVIVFCEGSLGESKTMECAQ